MLVIDIGRGGNILGFFWYLPLDVGTTAPVRLQPVSCLLPKALLPIIWTTSAGEAVGSAFTTVAESTPATMEIERRSCMFVCGNFKVKIMCE